MSGWEGTGRPFAMDKQLAFLAINRVFFKLPDVMCHIVDEFQTELIFCGFKKLHEGLADEVHDALPIVPRIVRTTRHRRDVVLSFG